MLSLHTKGQSSAGVKADVSQSHFWINQSSEHKSIRKTGGSAGFFYKYTFREKAAAMQANMLFCYRASELENVSTGETGNYSYFGIELPVYYLMQADLDNQIMYIGLGPFVSFGLNSRMKSDQQQRHFDLYKEDPTMMRRWDFGVGFNIGYELKSRLQFNFNYQLGLRNIVGDGFENVEMISQLIGLGAGYRF
jgi:hypothetical protein